MVGLTLRRSALTDVIDRAPIITEVAIFDSPANIGDGTKDELVLNLTAPLSRFGLTGAQLKGEATWRRSDVTDPTTGLPFANNTIPTDRMSPIALRYLANDVALRLANGANVSCSTSFNDGENVASRLATTYNAPCAQRRHEGRTHNQRRHNAIETPKEIQQAALRIPNSTRSSSP